MDMSNADGLSPSIKYMELDRTDDGVMVTIYYRHPYLSSDPETIKAVVLIREREAGKNHGGGTPTLSDYFFEVGVLFGMEPDRTVNWKCIVEPCAPNRAFWRATDYTCSDAGG